MQDVLTPSKTSDTLSSSSNPQETLPDLLRSNSYSLTRGGKVISSRPWSFHDAKGIANAMKRGSSQNNDEGSSSTSSDSTTDTSSESSSSSSSTASSGDEQTYEKEEEKANVPNCSRRHCTIDEEDELSEDANDADDTDSEETESTVIARPPPSKERNQDLHIDPTNGASPDVDGDTLSYVSGDLSFEHERSPFRDEGSRVSKSPESTVLESRLNEPPIQRLSAEDEDNLVVPQPLSSEEDPQLSRSFEFYSKDSSFSLLPCKEREGTLAESRATYQTKEDSLTSGESKIDPKSPHGGVFCLSGFPRSETTSENRVVNSSRIENGLDRHSRRSIAQRSNAEKEEKKKKDNPISVLQSSSPAVAMKYASTHIPQGDPKIGRRPPIPSYSHHQKNSCVIRKQQMDKYSSSPTPPNRSCENGNCYNHFQNPWITNSLKKGESFVTHVNGKIFVNNFTPQKYLTSNRCSTPARLKNGEDPSFRPPSSSARRSPQGHGADSVDCPLRCTTPSGGTSDGAYYGGCSPAHSVGSSPRRYSFGSSASGTAAGGKGASCGREERAQSLGNRTPCRHEDSEELSDISSGATSEDSTASSLRHSKKERKGEEVNWSSPMLTGLSEGHVTRLATPPDSRLASHLSGKSIGCEDVGVAPRHYRPRPPPAPRPRTLEGSELIPRHHHRVYSPSFHHSRDSSLERNGRDSSCERTARRHHVRPHHHYHHAHTPHSSHRDTAHFCWCEDEADYDSCDERRYSHRHSYHEGLHHAHLFSSLRPHPRENKRHTSGRSRRSASPCYCHLCLPVGSLNALTDPRVRGPMALPYTGVKVGPGATQSLSESDYIPLWSCHSPLNVEDRLLQLEGDKDSLQLQVSVLSEQVEAQTEKIHDLENILEQKRLLLLKTEEQLQKEVMTCSTLETQRLELLSEISNLKLRQAATERENMDLRDKIRLTEISSDQNRSQNFSPPASSTPLHTFHNNESPSDCGQHDVLPTLGSLPHTSLSSLSVIPVGSPNTEGITYPNNIEKSYRKASHKAQLPPRTPPPNARRKIDQFGTIPRQQQQQQRDIVMGHLTSSGTGHLTLTTGRSQKGVMFGKGFNNAFVALKGAGKRSTSAPNLAETEKHAIDSNTDDSFIPSPEIKTELPKGTATISPLSSHRSPSVGHKPTGIKKIFTKLRRSSSGHLENDLPEGGDLKRGGLRATATARLGWTSQTGLFKEPHMPFSSWSAKHMQEWLGNLGMSQYSAAAKCWMEVGNHIANATPHALEKDIGVRHPLHRKKLQLAISNRMSENNTLNKCCAKLDNAWVLRWLDDLGLPQYKDVFSESRIDGLVLNYLTYDDLAFLKITNLLHVTSLKRGIQVLREHNFDPSVLKRRSVPEEEKQPLTPGEVALWTNHRVMEWLKTVDLSEYAPNLRGSGVHGALMVYEVRFTSEFLASLLSISSSKTLLRRHLSTHFKELVGKEVVQAKRELEVSPGYIPLTTTAKIKMPRKSQFSLKRKKTKSDLEFDDLVCPLEEMLPKVLHPMDANKENPVDVN